MSRYEIITSPGKFDRNSWENFVKIMDNVTFYHSTELYDIYRKSKEIDPLFISIVKNNNDICGLAVGEITKQFRYISFTKRTVFYSMPLYENIEILNTIIKRIIKESKGLFVQIRPDFKLQKKEEDILTFNRFTRVNHLNAFIYINDLNEVWNNFEKDRRKGIEKALNIYKLRVIEESNNSGALVFYELQKKLYRKKRIPIKDLDYFRILLNYKNIFKIFNIYHGKNVICSQLVAVYKNRLTTLYTSSLPEYKHMHSGDLMIWHLIQYAHELGIKTFDFGGGGDPDKNYGPREYKKRFGTKFENVGRYNFYRYKFSKNFLEMYNKYKKQ